MGTPATLLEMFVSRVEASGGQPALWTKRDGEFVATNWKQLADQVRGLAAGLVRLGVQPGDRIVHLSENRYEWIITDLALIMAQAVHVPVHATHAAQQIAYQIAHAGARFILLSTAEQLAKVNAIATKLEQVPITVAYDCPRGTIAGQEVLSYESLLTAASGQEQLDVEQRALDALTPDSLATILYTSGTTGDPKGVMLSQHNLVSNTLAALAAIHVEPQDRRLTFLPLSHVFARVAGLYGWVASGCELALAESRETVLADCAAVRPTLLNGVPYFYDRLRRTLIEEGHGENAEALKQSLGGRIRMCCSGGAALPDHVFDFYQARDLPIYQGYGLTETSPVISASTLSAVRRGASGPPIPGVEVRIAEDGEILTRGPHVMVGYYRQPEATAEVIRDGWFYTGDLGRIDEDGFLYITSRKKEIIVTSGGKNIAPIVLETLLVEDPLILQALVVGDNRNYLTALIVPNPDELAGLVRDLQLQSLSPDQVRSDPGVQREFAQRIEQRLGQLSDYEQVRKFRLLDRPFSIESGEMTPKLTLRRNEIEVNFATEIEAMYGTRG